MNQWDAAAEAGFDFLECPLNGLAALTEEEYRGVLQKKKDVPVPISTCNCMLASSVKVSGHEADGRAQRAYLTYAFARAQELGVSVVVFGSGYARQVPQGFSFGRAWQQIISFLRLAGECGERFGMDIAIEPLRRQECNILNYVSEAVLLAAAVDHPRVRVLGDTFHMLSVGEPWEALSNAGALLRHVHVSHALPGLTGRDFPAPDDGGNYAEVFRTLKNMGYAGDISVEAGTDDLLRDGRKAAAVLRREMDT